MPVILNSALVFKPKTFTYSGQKNITCLGKAKLALLITFPGQNLEFTEEVFSLAVL